MEPRSRLAAAAFAALLLAGCGSSLIPATTAQNGGARTAASVSAHPSGNADDGSVPAPGSTPGQSSDSISPHPAAGDGENDGPSATPAPTASPTA
jgi:hypothetical protein